LCLTCELFRYKYLYDRLVTSKPEEFPIISFFENFGLDPKRPLSEDIAKNLIELAQPVLKHIQTAQMSLTASAFSTSLLQKMQKIGNDLNLELTMKIVLQAFTLSLPSDRKLQCRYEHQGSKECIGTDTFDYSERWMVQDVSYFLEYWAGVREPQGVRADEAWKCRSCAYNDICKKSPLEARKVEGKQKSDERPAIGRSISVLQGKDPSQSLQPRSKAEEKIDPLQRKLTEFLKTEPTQSSQNPKKRLKHTQSSVVFRNSSYRVD